MRAIRFVISLTVIVMSAFVVEAQDTVPMRMVPHKLMPAPVRRAVLRQVPREVREAPIAGKGHYTFGTILDGDTVPLYILHDVTIYASGMLLTQKEIKNNQKLIRNVRLMLPYAKEGKRRLDALEVEIAALPKRQRKAAIKTAEHQLLADYKGEISNYTFSQGLVLIKLIDRETNRTAYAIVGELRGSLRAGLYQTMAKLFGYNLKDTFDPKKNKKDDLIDRIAISIERGQL